MPEPKAGRKARDEQFAARLRGTLHVIYSHGQAQSATTGTNAINRLEANYSDDE